jgi:hypothetical protein
MSKNTEHSPDGADSIDSETDDDLPVEFRSATPESWEVVLCDGTFANLIIDLSTSDGTVPELRLYPSPHPFNWDNPTILPLAQISIPENPTPAAVPATDTDEFDFYIRIPDRDAKRRLVAVDASNIVPYVRIRASEKQNWANAEFSNYAVHFAHPD